MSSSEAPPVVFKSGSLEEFQNVNQQLIVAIKKSTKYIELGEDKEKVKIRIEETDKRIKDHKEFLKEKAVTVKKDATDFETIATTFEGLKTTYETKRDALANDEAFHTMLEEGLKKKKSFIKSVKKIVKGKPVIKVWSPHQDMYAADRKQEFADAMHTMTKANQDLTTLEQDMQVTKDSPKEQVVFIQEYQDLLLKTNEVIEQTNPLVKARLAEWNTFVEAIDAELVEKKERRAHPTAFMQAKMDYKEMRVKIAPVVGAKKAGVCAVM